MLSIGMLLGSPFPVQSSPRTIIRHVLSTRTCVNFLFLRVALSRAITSILIDGSPGRAKISRNWVIHTSIDRISELTLFCQEVILWTLPHSIDRVVPNEDYKYLMANLADAFSDCLNVNFRIPMVVPILK